MVNDMLVIYAEYFVQDLKVLIDSSDFEVSEEIREQINNYEIGTLLGVKKKIGSPTKIIKVWIIGEKNILED